MDKTNKNFIDNSSKFRPAFAVDKTLEGFAFIKMKHVCGSEMMICSACNRAFCVDCDCFISKIPQCCEAAKDSFFVKQEMQKTKVNIEEIGDGNL